MTNVFIGGSRRITEIATDVRSHLDRIIDNKEFVIIGDANGSDKAVQTYLNTHDYRNVQIFCADGKCRNNVGNWEMKTISVPKGKTGFDFYTAKDRAMADEASRGLMLWDGESRGTLTQMYRLVKQQKPVSVYLAPEAKMYAVSSESDWAELTAHCSSDLRLRVERYVDGEMKETGGVEQGRLL